MRIMTVVGARPQFIKAGPVSRAIQAASGIDEYLIHTGQHYDDEMSRVFFEELALPEPDANLGIGSGSHGTQTARMLEALEQAMLDQEPDLVLVYGDTNSTLAGALAAAKLVIPIAHVEAGLRSFRRDMPEEINRVLTDRVSALHFCPTQVAVENLSREGIVDGVHMVGDVMIDAIHLYREDSDDEEILSSFDVKVDGFCLLTVHRAENTIDAEPLERLLDSLSNQPLTVLFPVHPRTRSLLEDWKERNSKGNVRLLEPVAYSTMLALQANAAAVLTDSGGMQKEAYALQAPCVTLRKETEWTETLVGGWNRLTSLDPSAVTAALASLRETPPDPSTHTSVYGDGHAATRIVDVLAKCVG